ncbi:MAG TPA: asparagine synthase-related protein [Pyrinomonadaceae bacterium]|nr:asparagine synthase-related protein [Pyrinomonadaceae bacterium]
MNGIGGVFDFCNVPVSGADVEPLRTRSGHSLAWNGRLDNRDDLLGYFADGCEGDTSDVALVMAAYLKWGDDFLSRIVGDFVLSLYDPRSRTLFLARDPFGTRTLYYSLNNERLVWASTLEALLVATGIDPEVDDDYVAGYLALHPEMSLSPYKRISAVVPGHVVEIRKGHVQTRRFWKLDPEAEIRYSNDSDYEEQFRQLFRAAVRCRLRSDGPVWAELSGGLDSSSIVCVADQILAAGEAAIPRLETISYIDEDSTTCYDRSFIRVVEEMRGRAGHHLQSEKHWVSFVSPERTFVSKPHTGVCVEGTHKWLSREMKADNATVLLSGLGGDQLLWSVREATPDLTDLIYHRKPLALHRQVQVWSDILKQPYYRTLWQDAIVPLMSPSVAAIFQRQLKPAPWLSREFVKTANIKERLLLPPDPFGYRLPSSRRQASMVQFIISSIAEGECWEDAGFDKTYPFLHRPLVEFLMSIPFDQKLRGSETRSLMRRALKDVLPPKVLNRRNKGIVGETFCRGLADQWTVLEPMLADARVCRRGYVDAKLFRSALDLARHGRKIETSTLLKTIAIEIWLRSLEYRHVRSHEATWPNASTAFLTPDARAAVVTACS